MRELFDALFITAAFLALLALAYAGNLWVLHHIIDVQGENARGFAFVATASAGLLGLGRLND